MKNEEAKHDYTIVTELPGARGSREQIARLYARYGFASEFCKNKDVLEVACGAGIGLGYLAKHARTVVGGDIDENNLRYAREVCKGRINIDIRELDAQDLPYGNGTFDVVILYEAIYYLPKPTKFVLEARRILKNGGIILICTTNRDWSGFNPSPYSHTYFSAPELFELLRSASFKTVLYGGCPTRASTLKDKIISVIKSGAVKLCLIPKTMKGKEILKRVFMGKLTPLPPEIQDDMVEYEPPIPIDPIHPNSDYKVLFAVGYVA
ncbi:MAG TPA: class I SAM-dependent methyltransferase [Syntrophorhabdaceae bacterium]|nr:class I SAM-dependent methyltransferase [Syntrophorhabdaceae bacterium]